MITEEIQIAGEDLVKKIITERNNLWSNILNSGEPATEEEEKRLAELDKISQILEQEGITSVPRKLVTTLENFVNSNRTTKEMTDDEIKAVFEVKKNRIKTENNNIMNCFYDYLFKLDCNNIADYIKNNIEPYDIASYLLYTSGLYDREAYSSGVEWSYLNPNHLTSIFNKLYMLDKNYALEFVKMIDKLKILEPNEFIRSFYALAKNNFKFVVEKGQEKNASLVGLYGNYKDALECVRDINNSYYERMNFDKLDKLVSSSDVMKESFYNNIKEKLKEIDQEFVFELDNDIIRFNKELVYDDRKTNKK